MSRRSLWRAFAACLAFAPFSAGLAAAEAQRRFDLPAGDATQTLPRFAEQANREIVFSTAAVRGKTTNALRGEFAVDVALDRLVAGTGLTATRDASTGALAVRAISVPVGPTRSAAASGQPPGDRDQATAKENPVVLSPFEVAAGAEKGYLATQTLNGTRLNTALRDIGAAMTIFTGQLLDDLAATSVNDLASFAPNTDPYYGSLLDTTGNGNAFLTTQSPQYVTRGGATALISQDFFSTPAVPPDRYNAENFTFSRGPNAILFGLGNPAGAFTSATKRAQMRHAYSVELRGDDNGGLRATVDLNRVLVADRLALRYAGLREDAEGFRHPSDSSQRRHFLTARYTPFATTSLRANFEIGESRTLAIRPWPVYDGLSPWIAAGRPFIAAAGGGRTPPAGTQNAYAAAAASLVVTELTPAGSIVAPMSWLNQGRSANPSFPNFPNLNTRLSLINPALFPTDANVIGHGSFRDLDFKTWSFAWEQRVVSSLHLEAAFNRTMSDTLVASAFTGDDDRLYVDVNRQLPNGQPNPNAGLIYVDSQMNMLPNRNVGDTRRLTLSYDFDFAQFAPRRIAWLGKHRLAAFWEDNSTGTWSSQNPSQNTTPLPGANASILDLTNRIRFRYYLDPARGVTSAGVDGPSRYPILFGGEPLPAASLSGATPALAAIFGGTAAHTHVITRALATQSSFWRDRIVATVGFREDTQIIYRGTLTDFDPWRDARGLYPNPKLFEARRHFPRSRTQAAGRTFTRGLVFHALPWLSLTYNQSNNLQPNATQRDVAGALLANQEGDGRDYGVKFSFLDGRIVGDLVYYRNFGRNRPDLTVANGVHGNFQGDINSIWNTLAARENKPEYQNNPYAFPFSTWFDTNTSASDGYEGSLTANLTPQWRLTLNGGKRGPGETTNRGDLMRDYLARNLPLWRTPARLALTLVDNTTGGTIATAIARLENTLANFNALAALPTDSLFAPEWSANLVTSYAFARESRLGGVTVGASANVRGRTVIGFEEDAANVAVADRPYYAPEFVTTGAWISYRRKIFHDRFNWRVQLNVRNVADDNTIFPQRAVDRRDGTHHKAVVISRLNEPRTFILTSSLGF